MTLVRNGWYVGVLSDRLQSQPVGQTMLGDPVVFYRTSNGEAVALADRCPHRFAPLSKGEVKGDNLQCPYHGLQFNPAGVCAFNPHGDKTIPRAARVTRYPTVERDGIVWAWMGDPERAASTPAPDFGEFLGRGFGSPISGDFFINAHYETVLDNLLDLSHAPYLHPTTLASSSATGTRRVEMKQESTTVWSYHYFKDAVVTAQFAPFWDAAKPVDGHAHMRWDPPANLQLDVGVTEVGGRDEDGLMLHILHLLTPVTENRTRYTWMATRNFLTDNEELSEGMRRNIHLAFTEEDEPMIEAVYRNMGTYDLLSLGPVLLPADAAGIRARRILTQLRSAEGSGLRQDLRPDAIAQPRTLVQPAAG